MMRSFLCTYRLHNGDTGSLTMLAASSCDAVIAIAEVFGDRVKRLSVRPT